MTLWLSLVTTVGIQIPTFKGLLKCITSTSSKVMHPNSRLRSEFRHTPMWGIVGLGNIQDCCDIEFCSLWSLSTFYLVEQLNHPRVLSSCATNFRPCELRIFFSLHGRGLRASSTADARKVLPSFSGSLWKVVASVQMDIFLVSLLQMCWLVRVFPGIGDGK
jgi:hypothetical protein